MGNLSVDGLNIPIKDISYQAEFKKIGNTLCFLQESHFRYENMGQLKVKESEDWTVLISDKVDLISLAYHQ